MLAFALMAALLCAAGALPAQAKKGGIPALPDTASDRANPGKGVGAAPQLPNAAVGAETDAGNEVAQPPPPPPPDPPAGGNPDNGANDLSGPYDPDPADPGASGVGEPSGNGNSTDNNGNRPCAGCVGNADYKNPPGQLPDGGDHNKGYECDENQGVGKMNPAHSGCVPTPPTPPVNPPETPPTPPVTPPVSLPVTPPVTPPTQAVTPPAQPPDSPPPGDEGVPPGGVEGVDEAPELPELPQQPPVVEAVPVRAPVATTSQSLNALPFTGGQALRLGLLGFLALIAGLGLARVLRIRSYV